MHIYVYMYTSIHAYFCQSHTHEVAQVWGPSQGLAHKGAAHKGPGPRGAHKGLALVAPPGSLCLSPNGDQKTQVSLENTSEPYLL